jgi:hypothetical protein
MQRHLFWTRIGVAAVLAAGLMLVALQIVPGATAEGHLRMMAFVLVVPWGIALLVARPARLAGAFSSAFLGRPGEGWTTVKVLEFLGGLTIVAGVIGAFGSYVTLLETTVYGHDTITRKHVPGAVAALILPPAFALIVRLAIFEPVVWSLRRRFSPEEITNAAPAGLSTRWKVAMIVAATVLVVEGIRALVLGAFWRSEEPVPDTAIAAVRKEAVSTDPRATKPIRIELLEATSGTECRADGELIVAEPGRTDEVFARILRLRADDGGRPLEIEVAPAVPCKHLIGVMDGCVRVRIERPKDRGNAGEAGIRILVPSERPFAVKPRIRLARGKRRSWRDIVLVQLPDSHVSEPLLTDEDELPVINILYDPEEREAEIWAQRRNFSLDELEDWLHPIARSRVDGKTGASEVGVLIRCDRDAPSRTILQILALLAAEELRVSNVLLEVLPARDD